MDEVLESLQVAECQWCSQYLKWYKGLLVSNYKIHTQNSSVICKGESLGLNLEA